VTVPDTAHHYQLLDLCLRWVGAHLTDPADDPYRTIVCSILCVPTGKAPLVPADFIRAGYDLALAAYREIVYLGAHYEIYGWPDTPESSTAKSAWEYMQKALGQQDLNENQTKATHVEAMVVGLIHWLTYTPGGLREAVDDQFPHGR